VHQGRPRARASQKSSSVQRQSPTARPPRQAQVSPCRPHALLPRPVSFAHRHRQLAVDISNLELTKYGVVESTRRLESTGFHPAVTSLSLDEYMDKWIQQQQRLNDKPSRAFVLGDPEGYHGAYGQSVRRQLTIVSPTDRCIDIPPLTLG
jgi:hypothetical protein